MQRIPLLSAGIVPCGKQVPLLESLRGRTGKPGDIAVPRGIHHRAGDDALSSRFVFDHHRADAVFLTVDSHRVCAVEDIHPLLQKEFFRKHGKKLGIIAYPKAHILFRSPGRIIAFHPVCGPRSLMSHGHGKPQKLFRDTEGHLTPHAVAKGQIHRHKSRSAETAKHIFLFQKDNVLPLSCRSKGRRYTAETAAANQHIALSADRCFSCFPNDHSFSLLFPYCSTECSMIP